MDDLEPLDPDAASLRAHESLSRVVEESREVFSIATAWATRGDLFIEEACHGLAHELYKKYGHASIIGLKGNEIPINVSDGYAKRYDLTFADKIKTRYMRSAKELFDLKDKHGTTIPKPDS